MPSFLKDLSRKFTVIRQGLTAADHGAIIVQALLILKERAAL